MKIRRLKSLCGVPNYLYGPEDNGRSIHAKKKTVAGCFTVFDTVFFKSYCYNFCAVVRFRSFDVAYTRRYNNNDDYLEIGFRYLSVFYMVAMYNSAIIINLC